MGAVEYTNLLDDKNDLRLIWSFKSVIINALAISLIVQLVVNSQDRDPFSNGAVLVNKNLDCSDVNTPVMCHSLWGCAKQTCTLARNSPAYTSITLITPPVCNFTTSADLAMLPWGEVFFLIATVLSILYCALLSITNLNAYLYEFLPKCVTQDLQYTCIFLLLIFTRIALYTTFVLCYNHSTTTLFGYEMLSSLVLTTGAFMLDLGFDVVCFFTQSDT
jgi:hypothetical protein